MQEAAVDNYLVVAYFLTF